MVLGDDDFGDEGDIGAPEWLKAAGGAATQAGQAAAAAGLQNVVNRITGSGAEVGPGGPPVKEEGIPKPVLMIGAGLAGLLLLKTLFGRSKRVVYANPRRRRRRRRR